MQRFLILVPILAACGGSKPATTTSEPAGPVTDSRSAFEQRLATACENVGKKLTACAIADTDAKLAAGEIKQKEHDELVKPDLTDALTRKYLEKCDQPDKRSSRQLRVLEVCFEQEQECAPLLDCLDNLNKQ